MECWSLDFVDLFVVWMTATYRMLSSTSQSGSATLSGSKSPNRKSFLGISKMPDPSTCRSGSPGPQFAFCRSTGTPEPDQIIVPSTCCLPVHTYAAIYGFTMRNLHREKHMSHTNQSIATGYLPWPYNLVNIIAQRLTDRHIASVCYPTR